MRRVSGARFWGVIVDDTDLDVDVDEVVVSGGLVLGV